MTEENYYDVADTIHMLKSISLNPLIDGINASEYTSLKILNSLIECSSNDSVYVSDITRQLKISSPSVSKILNKLESKGLVIREIDRNSRRKTFVYITEKGIETKEKNDFVINNFVNNVCERVGKENIEQFQYLAEIIHHAIEEEIDFCIEHNDTMEVT